MDSGMIFENFTEFLKESDDEMNTPQGAIRLLREDTEFNNFIDTLSEGLDDSARAVVQNVLSKQREHLLSESANVGPSVFTHENWNRGFKINRNMYITRKNGGLPPNDLKMMFISEWQWKHQHQLQWAPL